MMLTTRKFLMIRSLMTLSESRDLTDNIQWKILLNIQFPLLKNLD